MGARLDVIDGALVGQSQDYAHGRERTEFYFRREFTPMFGSFKVGQRLPIRLKIRATTYAAGLRLYERTGCIYICPNLRMPGGAKADLTSVMEAVGVRPGQKASFRLLPGELRYYAAGAKGRPKQPEQAVEDSERRHDLGYESLTDLITDRLVQHEETKTAELIGRLRAARERGYLTKDEFVEICCWKSSRALRWYTANTADRIIAVTRKVLSTQHERRKIELLTDLKGVEIPTASAILTLTDPERYGVIDIRVRKVLYRFGAVKENPKGQNFTFDQWHAYLKELRAFARLFATPARNVERTLFEYHRTIQKGPLY